MAQPLINGAAYEWADIQVTILGVQLYGITKVSYRDSVEKVNLYGQGKYPVERGSGNYTAEASMTLTYKEYSSLIAAAPNASLMNIPPFDVIITFINLNNITQIVTLRNAEFMTDGIDSASGDTQIEVVLDMVISHIDR